MSTFSTYVGLDVHKNSISAACCSGGGSESAVALGRLPNDLTRVLRMLRKLGAPSTIQVCYEAGPTGYGLARRLREEGYACEVVAPAKTPKVSSNRVKTDKRDAVKLASFLRSGHLTFVRVPTAEEEAMRDLIRAREDLKQFEVATKRRLNGLLLRHGRIWHKKSLWTKEHLRWVERQEFELEGTTVALGQYRDELRRLEAVIAEFDRRIEELVPTMGSELAQALPAMKGIKTLTAATVVAEVGDLRRFPSASHFMSFLGFTPSESSSGDTQHRGPITKAGNRRLRRLLVEAAWAYQYSPHESRELKKRSEGVAPGVREIAWKAQRRLHRRMKSLCMRGKSHRKALVAVARELSGFIWAIAHQEEMLIASN